MKDGSKEERIITCWEERLDKQLPGGWAKTIRLLVEFYALKNQEEPGKVEDRCMSYYLQELFNLGREAKRLPAANMCYFKCADLIDTLEDGLILYKKKLAAKEEA